MTGSTRLRPRNWNEFQHYRRRSPPWVKLHKKLLDDYEFQNLPIASKALAPMLWLLASEDGQGWIDAEAAKIAFRLRMSQEELDQAIQPLIDGGFFEREDASSAPASDVQDAAPESESEKEAEDSSVFFNAPSDLRGFAFGAPAHADAPASAATALGSPGCEPRPSASALTRAQGREVPTKYTEEFETFWSSYPTDSLMSKKRASEEWELLPPPDREAARAAIPAFRDYCRKHPTYRPVHAERFLSQRRFDGFASAPELSEAQIEANKDRADRLMRRGKYAVSYQ